MISTWEQRKLEDIYGSIGNAFVGTATPYYVESGHFYLESNNIKDGQINHNTEVFINDEFYEKQKDKWLHTGDMVMVQSGHVGHAAVIPEELNNSAAHALIMFRNPKKEIEPYFLNYQYQTLKSKKKIENITTGNTIKHILASEMQQFEVDMPELAEQKKIAEYFRALDHLITLHQRKLEHVKKMKKSMLQKMFPKKNQLYPEVRFPGFTDAWEQRKLPEFVSFFNGLTYTPDDVQETGTLVLRSSNVKNGEIVDADNVYVSDEVVTSENVKEGDIIVVVRNGSRALIGKHAQIKASMPNTVIGAFMSGIRSEHSSFVNALLDTSAFENEIAKNMGATINQITGYMFSKMEFMIPSGEEQDKIGAYFKQLDHLITLHQRKLEHVKKMKKSMLQKMFPKKNQLYPEVRFPGFTDAWEQRKLGELVKEGILEAPLDGNHGEKHPTSDEYVDSGIPFLMASDIHNGEVNIYSCKYITKERAERLDKGFARNGDVLLTHKATIGETAILSNLMTEYAMLTPQVTYYRIKNEERLNREYLYSFFNSLDFQTELKTKAAQSTRPYIGITAQQNLKIILPAEIDEQIRIGLYFRNLDHLITLHQRELDHLQLLKKGMLQQMFI